ncbi:MAG TPA: hypothetical protein VL326_31460, partial [Kofleriaceae bacterium]|nr:hypothetical protein [Kofleriaceae bacterium]
MPTRTEMLAALPADTNFVAVVEVKKLQRSPIAVRGWEVFQQTEGFANSFGAMCGADAKISYALIGFNSKTDTIWAWVDGAPRDTKLDCAAAIEHRKTHPSTTTRHGDYEIELSDKNVTETYWLDNDTAFVAIQNKGAEPFGADKLHHTASDGGGFANASRMQSLLDHVNFASGLAVVFDGEMLKQPGVEGMAVSLELDDGVRAQTFVQFDNEDKAAELRGTYRAILDRGIQGHVIDSGETRVSGTGMAASITLTRSQ